jgi:chemosensory pili system protein ChpA (sensor histidine kinase/response regulator)
MELERELAEVFLEEARGHLALIADAARPLPARGAAAEALSAAAGLVGLDAVKAAAEAALAALRGGAEPRLAELEAALDRVAGGAPRRSAPRSAEPSGLDAGEQEQLLAAFRAEAAEHIDAMTAALLVLERDPRSAQMDALLRQAHTLKGSAATVGLGPVAEAAHALEDALLALRAGRAGGGPVFDQLHDALDALRALDGAAALRALGARSPGAAREPIVIRGDDEHEGHNRRKEDREHVLRVEAGRLDQLMDAVGELVFDRTRIERRVGEMRTIMRELGRARAALRALVRQQKVPKLGGPAGPAPEAGAAKRSPLEELEESFGSHIAHLTRATGTLLDDADALRRTTGTLQKGLTLVRMTKVRLLFQRLARPLRDLERLEGKRVTIVTSGGDVELDKAVVEKVVDPLIQLLRNALAHGIEPVAIRLARGKPAEGQVTLAARHEGDAVFLEVADDGAGIDAAKVRASLVASGRLTADEAAGASDEQIVAAIFEPGVSTREGADELAGRGVGLDVVRENIARLGGEIAVASRPGAGTRFSIRLPLTTAITQAFLFKVAGQVYALPNVHVVESRPLEASTPELPLVSLHKVLGVEPPADPRRPTLIIDFAGRRLAATCDKVIGPREIVVKSLGPLLAPLGLYAGATISGAGKVQLILDPAALAQIAHPAAPLDLGPERRSAAHSTEPDAAASHPPAPVAAAEPLPLRPRVLVADDSRTVREALARMLSSEGYVVDLAIDGQEAWDMLHEVRYDVVVTDLEMPRVGGAELVRRLRADNALRATRVIAISSRDPAGSDADAFIAKPVPRRVLAQHIERLVRR